ncbi:MAG: FAD-dependent oxidoreductase [Ilumatobacteraceae bacterium]
MTASWCVVATGYEVEGLLPELPFVLHSTFALVSEPIPGLDERLPDGLPFWEYADPYVYGRTTDDGRMLIGGKDETYRDPLRRRRAIPAKTRGLESSFSKFLPDLELEVGHRWAGTFAETPDGLAYIGGHDSRLPVSRFSPRGQRDHLQRSPPSISPLTSLAVPWR